MSSVTARRKAAHKAKQRRRAARRKGLLKVHKPGGRLKGRLRKVNT